MLGKFTTAIAATALLATSGAAGADEAADGAVKFRQQVMNAVAASAGGIAGALKGNEDYAKILGELTALLAAAADEDLTRTAFAMNTTGLADAKTTATAKVWDEPDDFQAGLTALSDAAAAIGAKGADVSMDDLKPLFKECKACHDSYREK